jgi:alcohol dehydrogenase (cytochrome c)
MEQVDAENFSSAPAFIEGERGLIPAGGGPDDQELLRAGESGENWLYHTGNYHGTRYSPLAEINSDNVDELRVQCIYQVGDRGNFQTGPIVHDGTMYITGVHVTAAIDAATCLPIWRHVWAPQDREVWLNNRGVAIKDGYVVRGTSDGYLLALDSADGTLLWGRQVANPWLGETFTMAPMIFEDRILIGPAGSENAISGWVGAFRLSDGEPLWRFNTVPGATLAGGETWGNPEGILLGGGAVWTPFSLDPDRGELYVAVTNPAPDLPAYLRPGENLYTNSIVALDVRSGELRWYEQAVPADDHDWDLTQVSPVFQARVAGRTRNLVATVGKDGLLRVIDRDTQERVYEAEVTTRTNVDAAVTTEGTYACPGILGGVEWNGPSLHPGVGVLVTPAVDYCFTFYAAEEVRYVEGENYLGGRVEPDLSSWSGWLTAVDASDGSIRWRYRSPSPMIAAVTTTAGGLVLSGELTGDFLVLEATNGEVLYRFQTGGPIGGGVVSYEVEDRQYLAVASGRPSQLWVRDHAGSSTIVVFSLP